MPETRYARSGDLSIAYQVVGDGPVDLVFVPGFVSNVETWWEHPTVARFWERMASFSRLIMFDKRGTGLSDRVPLDRLPTLEERMDDLRAVMAAAGSDRACVLGVSEGGPLSVLFAATYPDRVSSLVLYGSAARFSGGPDYPWMLPPQLLQNVIDGLESEWGGPALMETFVPSRTDDEAARQWWARFLRTGGSPSAARAVMQMAAEIDVSPILPTVQAPALVLHQADDPAIHVENGRILAREIPDARFVELPGADHVPFFDSADQTLDEIEEFVTGARAEREPDRVLSTVMFTDIVGSTERAAELGDRRWRELLETHDTLMRRQIERHRGRPVKTMGDGFLATFDGPARAIRCAGTACREIRELGLEIRTGLHTGECEVMGDDVGGMAVNIGARVSARAAAGEVLVSGTVKDLVVGSGIDFEDRGAHPLKGVPGEWRLYAVRDWGRSTQKR